MDGQPIAIGNTAEIFEVDGHIVKRYLRESAESVSQEARNQAFARSLGLRVPEVLEIIEVDGSPAMVMEHVPGETMLAVINRDPNSMPYWLQRSIELQYRMHTLDAPNLRPMVEKLDHQIRVASGLSEAIKTRLLQQLGGIGSTEKLCHGDFHVQNLIVHQDDITVIDWMDATRGDPRLDVCRSYVLYSGVDISFADRYLEAYCQLSGIDRKEFLEWIPVIAAARLSEGLPASEVQRLSGLIESS